MIEFEFKPILAKDASKIDKMQHRSLEVIENKNNLVLMEKDEIIESIKRKEIYGMYDNDTLAGFFTILNNIDSPRNYIKFIKGLTKDFNEVLGFDMLVVEPEYWGNHGALQAFKFGIEYAKKDKRIKYIAATVSPSNSYSYNNLIKSGFTKYGPTIIAYDDKVRDIVVYKVK